PVAPVRTADVVLAAKLGRYGWAAPGRRASRRMEGRRSLDDAAPPTGLWMAKNREETMRLARTPWLLPVVLAGFALSAGAQAVELEKPALKLPVGGKTLIAYLPLTIAERRGYFTREGLRVEIED